MIQRFGVAAALVCCCVAGMGCQTIANCGDGCGRSSSMAFQKYDCSCDGACGNCCGGAGACGCDTACNDPCAGSCSENDPPLRRAMNWAFGCNGCGECYWNEWQNDPPPVCEPCDRCGHYTGPGGVGDYRAPYRRHDGFAGTPSELPPLEVAAAPTETDGDFLP